MKAYFLVFFLTLILSLVLPSKTDEQFRWKLFWMFIPLFVFAAIRVNFGNDYVIYEVFYNEVHKYSSFQLDRGHHLEPGFQLLNFILPSFRSLLVLNAFLLCLALGVFLYHSVPKNYLWLAVILIFLNPEKNIYGNLVGIRNGLVVTLFLLGFGLIQKQKWGFFFLLIAALFTIHKSVVFFLPLAYLVGQNRPFSKKEIWIWLGAILILLMMPMSRLMDIFTLLLQTNDEIEVYQYYLQESSKHRGVLMVISSLLLFFIIISSFNKLQDQLSPNDNSLFRMGLLYVFTCFLGSLAMRASYFYDLFFIATVVTIVSKKEINPNIRLFLACFAIIISCYSMFVIWMGSPWWGHSVYHCLLGSW